MSQFPGTVASVNAPNFASNNLPALFTSNGINQVQVVVSSGTEFEGVSGGSSLTTGESVVLRGLPFKTGGDQSWWRKRSARGKRMTELRGIVSSEMVPSESVKRNSQETTNSKRRNSDDHRLFGKQNVPKTMVRDGSVVLRHDALSLQALQP
jgi:hypothetical protein